MSKHPILDSLSAPVISPAVPTHDNTMMSALSYCERLYGVSHVLHKKFPEKRTALSFGGLLHIGLDAFYVSYKEDDEAGVERDPVKAAERMIQVTEAAEYVDPDSDYRTKGRAQKVLVDYIIKYQQDLDIRTILFTETPFDITQEDGFRWGGVMDLWYEDGDVGGWWLMDHKSTSRKEKYFFDNFTRDPQMLGYMMAGFELHGQEVRGVVINCLHVLTGSHDFERKHKEFPGWLIEEAKDMQIMNYVRAEQIREDIERPEDVFDVRKVKPNFYNCVGKYGRCPLWGLCHEEPEKRLFVMENEMEDHVWDWRERED